MWEWYPGLGVLIRGVRRDAVRDGAGVESLSHIWGYCNVMGQQLSVANGAGMPRVVSGTG
jgi:hypothetical protein